MAHAEVVLDGFLSVATVGGDSVGWAAGVCGVEALLREGLSRDRIALPDRGLTGCADFAAIDQRLQVLVLPCVNSRAVHAQNYFARAIFRPSQGIAASKIRGRLASR